MRRYLPESQFTLSAGRYRIADPRCVLSERNYRKLVEPYGDEDEVMMLPTDKGRVVSFRTAHGDGTFPCAGCELDVDSGMIAIVPEALAEGGEGLAVEFNGEFETGRTADGLLVFGKYEVDTE